MIAIYLYVYLGVLMLLKSAVLHDVGITYWDWGLAAAKAMVLAKFMLIGDAFRLGQGYEKRPLIWPTLYRSLIFLALLLVLKLPSKSWPGWFTGDRSPNRWRTSSGQMLFRD